MTHTLRPAHRDTQFSPIPSADSHSIDSHIHTNTGKHCQIHTVTVRHRLQRDTQTQVSTYMLTLRHSRTDLVTARGRYILMHRYPQIHTR